MTNGTNEAASRSRRVIPATCSKHGGCRGFTNIVLTKVEGVIVLCHHDVGACVIELGEDAATAVRDTITEWLG